MGRIVVGVDGSPESDRALAWAFEEARLSGDELTVVHVYSPPKERSPYATGYAYLADAASQVLVTAALKSRAELHQRARQRAQALVDAAIRRVAGAAPDVPARPVVVEGERPARVLIDFARNARLLVVGSRGRGAVSGRLLGSVSQACARHAPTAVVVVTPHTSRRATPPVTV